MRQPAPEYAQPAAEYRDRTEQIAAEYADHAEQAADRAEPAAEHADHAEPAADHAEYAERAAEHADHADHAEQAADAAEHAEPSSDDTEYAEPLAGSRTLRAGNRQLEAELPSGVSWQLQSDVAPRYARIGAEGLARLRARYAEIMARISEQSLEESVRDELRTRAERLNPDAWVTEEEVAAALEQYETVFEALRPVVGRHPRRRRRRQV